MIEEQPKHYYDLKLVLEVGLVDKEDVMLCVRLSSLMWDMETHTHQIIHV